MSDDAHWMRRAIELARHGVGQTYPNPAVGAVIVRSDHLLGEGYHAHAGGPHAEIHALHDLYAKGFDPKEAEIYITLEPCSTYGRTPPCTNALIQCRMRRVVIGLLDPNPRHRGRGVKLLEQAGIQVTVGILESDCRALNPEWTGKS